ncbi:MAG: hypothetical protein Fur0020_09090 [Thermodesulfovibrionia bacterium]
MKDTRNSIGGASNSGGVGKRNGIALIMVLWVLAILMVIVLSTSYMTRTETHAAISFRTSAEERFLAEAGIEKAIIELFYRRFNPSDTENIWRIDCTPYRVETDNGYAIVTITDESSKVDINKAPDIILRNLFFNLGIDEDEVDTIVDSIMDWRDPDDLHRLHGAESDYYMSLPNPYKAKNRDFDAVEELLLVKGIDRKILYGDREKPGIIDFVTVHSETNRINIRTASREVLLSIPGVTPDMADTIISLRNDPTINLQQALGKNYSLISRYVSLGDSNTYTIDSVGHIRDDRGYGIRATVMLFGGAQYRYLYYKSPMGITLGGDKREADETRE